ncbi:uncharacterized protein LOC122366100 [Amphibalanus amphitrite]|uniref:uncharacterized protein LOC122366100 n=1 Tax=Amphibalanus amphitrite TaxID=1232801 RepID=UPI001C9275F4|nr:uncharacterized protein LOC122366100 [Amphibalanus amphitrite]
MLSAEEIGIIIIVLGVWMMAIVLFFNRWGKIRMLEPYEYNFKYHHPIPEVANHRPSCPLADGAPLLQTSFDRHCSLDRRLAPYGRRCSSLSAYLSTEPRMIRNNSDPAPPHPPGQPRPGAYRSSMQELRRETTHYGPDLAPAAGRPARTAQDSPVAVAVVQGAAETSGVSRVSPAPPQAGVGRGSPTVARRETGREVGLTRGRSVVAEEGRLAGEAGGRRAEPSRALERPRELLLNLERDGHPAETGTAPGKTSEPDRRQKLTKPFRLICRETETEPARDSEV